MEYVLLSSAGFARILFEIIQNSLQNASAFESTAELLRTQHQEAKTTDGVSYVLTRVVENIGSGAPEDVASGRLTAKCDVYSFGVVLLEILSGRRSVDTKRPSEEHNLVDWAKLCLSKSWISRVVDALLDGQYSWESVEEVAKLILKCVDNIDASSLAP